MKFTGYFLILFTLTVVSSCNLFQKKNNEALERLQQYQEEVSKKQDSIRQQDYKELMDSVYKENNKILKDIDSLKKKSDSMGIELEKSMKKLNQSITPEKIDKKNKPNQ